jgi:hypothetical protein
VVLQKNPSYPASRAYVLKLHRDASPASGRIVGRLESVLSGQQFEFNSGEELLACLARALAQAPQEP